MRRRAAGAIKLAPTMLIAAWPMTPKSELVAPASWDIALAMTPLELDEAAFDAVLCAACAGCNAT